MSSMSSTAELIRVLRPYQLQDAQLERVVGLDAYRKQNLCYLGDNRVLTVAGNTALIIDVHTCCKTVLFGHGVSIGAIAVHPHRTHFAVAECGLEPKILIYRVSDLAVIKVLRGGAEAGFGALDFDPLGTCLASVSSAPDYYLNIWDWQTEKLMLKTKAFSQDVTRVAFSPHFPGQLVTSGLGHIRFWAIAATFTGLKLQGSIGKFGLVEISDIDCFVQLPSGKVVSGSESGALLIWDGPSISGQVRRSVDLMCHQGNIKAVILYQKYVLSIGDDGFLRAWTIESLETELTDDDHWHTLTPAHQVLLGENMVISSLCIGDDGFFFLIDQRGALQRWACDLTAASPTQLQHVTQSHSGPINASVLSPREPVMVSGGDDGTLRAWNLSTGQLIYSRLFTNACTCLHWATKAVDPEHGNTIVAGFEDGVIRVMHRRFESFVLASSAKPHTSAVKDLATSDDGKWLVTTDITGAVFFFSLIPGNRCESLVPVGVTRFRDVVHSLSVSPYASDRLLAACGDEVIEMKPATAHRDADVQNDTLNVQVDTRSWRCDFSSLTTSDSFDELSKEELEIARLRRAEKERELSEAEREDAHKRREVREVTRQEKKEARISEARRIYLIGRVTRAPRSANEFLFSIRPQLHEAGSYPRHKVECVYRANMDSVAPSKEFVLGGHAGVVTCLHVSPSHNLLLIGTTRGRLQVRSVHEPNWFFEFAYHHGGTRINSAAAACDERFVFSTGEDSMIFCYQLQMLSALAVADKSVDGSVALERERRQNARRERRKLYMEEVSNPILETTIKINDQVEVDSDQEDDQFEEKFSSKVAANVCLRESDISNIVSNPAATTVQSAVEALDAVDCLAVSSYSLEEAKAKKEEDEWKIFVSQRKTTMKDSIAQKRQELRDLMQQQHRYHTKIHSELHSDRTHEICLDHINLLDVELEKAVEDTSETETYGVGVTLDYDMEVRKVQLQKLTEFFLEPVEFDSYQICEFNITQESACLHERSRPLQVWSYRVAKLPLKLQREIAAVHHKIQWERENTILQRSSVTIASPHAMQPQDTTVNASIQLPSKEWDRDSLRGQRQARFDWLLTNKPPGEALLSSELAALEECAKAMGDFKLKSATDFVVTEDRAINAEMKHIEFIMLCESMYELKMAFNDKLDALRTIKQTLEKSMLNDQVDLEQVRALRHGSDHFQKCNEIKDTETLSQCRLAIKTVAAQANRAAVLRRVSWTLQEFNAALASLHWEKLKLDYDLCAIESRVILCQSELSILAEFEERESAINDKRRKLVDLKRQVKGEQTDLERATTGKMKELANVQDLERQIAAEFITTIGGEKNEFFALLNKIFRKRIKRRKRRAALNSKVPVASSLAVQTVSEIGVKDIEIQEANAPEDHVSDDEAQDNSDDSDPESTAYSGSEESDSDGDSDELCPPHCPVMAYEKSLEFRERRLENEDASESLGKALQELSRGLERIGGKEKALEREWLALENEHQVFQRDKQRQLNLVETAINIDSSQARVSPTGSGIHAKLPESLTQALVFTDSSLTSLHSRIATIEEECFSLSNLLSDARREGRNVEKENENWSLKISQEVERCESVQTLKFGRLVDIDFVLRGAGERQNQAMTAKQTSLLNLEDSLFMDREVDRVLVQNTRNALRKTAAVNTQLLKRQGELTKEQFNLETGLNSTVAAVVLMQTGESKREEEQQLLSLVHIQEQEIEQLKLEMGILRRKASCSILIS